MLEQFYPVGKSKIRQAWWCLCILATGGAGMYIQSLDGSAVSPTAKALSWVATIIVSFVLYQAGYRVAMLVAEPWGDWYRWIQHRDPTAGGWLYLIELSIVNQESRNLSLRPYLLIAHDPRRQTRVTLASCDVRSGESDPWPKLAISGDLPRPSVRVDVLNTDAHFIQRGSRPPAAVRKLHQSAFSRPIALGPRQEKRGWVAFRLGILGIPVEGAGFMDKKRVGHFVTNGLPPSEQLVLEDALSDRAYVRAPFDDFRPEFYGHLRAQM